VRTRELPDLLSGEQHPSHVLYGRHNGRRFAVYVPEDLVGEVRRAVDNGACLQDLLVQAGPRYVKGVEARAGHRLKRKKSWPWRERRRGRSALRCRTDAAGPLRLEPLLEAISKFLDSQHGMIDRVRRDLVRG